MTEQALSLRRILYLLNLLSMEFEYFAMDLPADKRTKWEKVYKAKGVDWILRDIKTSTRNAEVFDGIFTELNSERAKDLGIWMDVGIDYPSIEQLLRILDEAVKSKAA